MKHGFFSFHVSIPENTKVWSPQQRKSFKLDFLFYHVIKRLKIKNFKSFRDSELEFGKVNIVVGSNGSADLLLTLKGWGSPRSQVLHPFTGATPLCSTRNDNGFFTVKTEIPTAFFRIFNAPFKSLCSLCPLGQLTTPLGFLLTSTSW
jgi:hypothetical protein